MTDRENHKLQAVSNAKFIEDVREVMLDGLLAQRKLQRDIFIRESTSDCRDHL